MKANILLVIFSLLLVVNLDAQRSSRKNSILQKCVSLMMTYDPSEYHFGHAQTIEISALDFDHTFLQPTSGIFTVDSLMLTIGRTGSFQYSNKVKFGFSIQTLRSNGLFVEFDFIGLGYNKRRYSYFENRIAGLPSMIVDGEEYRFINVGMRYGFGKYFNLEKQIRFGLSLKLQSQYINVNSKNLVTTASSSGIYGDIIDLRLLFAPLLSFKLGVSTYLDLELNPQIPLLLLDDLKTKDPTLSLRDQMLDSNTNYGFNLSFSLKFRYAFFKVDNNKRRRRR